MAASPAEPASRALSALLALTLGLIAVVTMAVGAGAGASQALSPFLSFRIFGVGLLLGLAAFLFGAVGLVRSRPGSGRQGAAQAWIGLGLGGLALLVLVAAGSPGAGLPAINDITTSPDDPPAFSALARLARERGAPMKPLDEATIRAQKDAYDLAPSELPIPPALALAHAEQAARELGWTLVEVAPASGRLEATDVTGFFHFVDDVVVRVRPLSQGGAVVDVRSKSRVGKGDVGANAARIRAFQQALEASS